MGGETNLWLIRHAPVDGPRGIIHGPDAPADTSDAAAFAALKAKLPPNAFAVCSPARRTWETAIALGLDPVKEPAFREQDFGAWTGRRHNDLVAVLGDAYRDFWQSPASNHPPGGESFVDQILRAAFTRRQCRPCRAFRHYPRRARRRARSEPRRRAAFRDRSAVADADRSPRQWLARDRSQSALIRRQSEMPRASPAGRGSRRIIRPVACHAASAIRCRRHRSRHRPPGSVR
jgi:hypothetical protein